MELWWIILAGCGGGLLLFAYLAFVIYKVARHKRKKWQRDPEGLPDDQDWSVHVRELIERRQDGLCLDSLSGSTKLRRTLIIPGDDDAVLKSVATLGTPVTSSRNDPTGKQDAVQDVAAGNSFYVDKGPAPKEIGLTVDQRTEYKWEEVMRQSRNNKIKRSRSCHGKFSEHRASIRSMNFNVESQGQRGVIKSKSLRVYKSHGSPSDQTFSFNEHAGKVASLMSRDVIDGKGYKKHNRSDSNAGEISHHRTNNADSKCGEITRSEFVHFIGGVKIAKQDAREALMENSKPLQWFREPGHPMASTDKLEKGGEKGNAKDNLEKSIGLQGLAAKNETRNMQEASKHVSRSGSAPSTRAKESVVKRESEQPLRQRSVSLRWLPEPDYHSVSMEELVLANQSYDKCNTESNVCVVEIHSPPTNPEANASKSVDGGKTDNGVEDKSATSDYLEKSNTESSVENQLETAAADFGNKLSFPGVAKRLTSDRLPGDKKRPENTNATAMEAKGDTEKAVSVKDLVQNLQGQIPQDGFKFGAEKSRSTKANHEVRTATLEILASNSNNAAKFNAATTVVVKEEPKVDDSPGLLPSLINESAVKPVGKMKTVKNNDAPAWLANLERTHGPIRQSQPVNLERTSSMQINLQKDHSSTTALSRTDNKNETTRPSTSELIKTALKNKNKTSNVDINNNISNEDQQDKLSESTEPTTTAFADGPGCVLPIDESVNEGAVRIPLKEDVSTVPSLEEKKRNWKREQIVDQLHSARQRNSNQNYIFGTGLAYQSCMPELQNKLKQLTLAK